MSRRDPADPAAFAAPVAPFASTEPSVAVTASPLRWRQITIITLSAVALYAGFRALPTGTNLHPVDFSVPGQGMVELCDPTKPQFVSVATARSPVTMTLRGDLPAVLGRESGLTLTLTTATGKPVGPVDLLVQHTRKLHLLVVDPTLRDYQHVHPEPSRVNGEWTFRFTPRLTGNYRVFSDFVPARTARGLYAVADLPVEGDGAAAEVKADVAAQVNRADRSELSWTAEAEGYRFTLTPGAPVTAGREASLAFELVKTAGGPVALEPVMGAYAHLVAFDSSRSGFAHLHPTEATLTATLDVNRPQLTFKITIPASGRYVIWAQVKLNGREVFVPFWFEVAP